jgi:two-component system NtrC family sensor kinase
MKTRRRKTTKVKHRKEPTAARGRASSPADLQKQLDQRTRELAEARKLLAEALEQQTATSEVLQVISGSVGELQPVFQAMLANATRLCGAKFGVLFLHDGGLIRVPAHIDVPDALRQHFAKRDGLPPTPGTAVDHVIRHRQAIHVPDIASKDGLSSPAAKLAGARSYLAVPLLKDDAVIGVFAVYREEVRPFTDKQIALVTNFANQAVIAIENVRLLNELRESLQQQTATSDVLKVISRSPTHIQPVFDTIVENVVQLGDAVSGLSTDSTATSFIWWLTISVSRPKPCKYSMLFTPLSRAGRV